MLRCTMLRRRGLKSVEERVTIGQKRDPRKRETNLEEKFILAIIAIEMLGETVELRG
jgi:hypothetical protein